MNTTCLPPEAYYRINRNQNNMLKLRQPEKPEIMNLLALELETKIATTHDWESAFVLVFGQRAFEEEYPCIDWTQPRREWAGEAAKFASAFTLADRFVASVMHRLFPFQYREMIPALTHGLMSWSRRRECPIPYFISEEDAIKFLNYAGYENMAEWLEEQQ